MDTKTTYLPLNLFEFFKNLKGIYSLHTYTKLTALKSGHFFGAEKLESIFIVNQNLEDLSAKVFYGAPNAKIIKLDNDGIKSLDEDAFFGLPLLEDLSMKSNDIKSLPHKVFEALANLVTLDLSSNLISAIPESVFSKNQNLSRIKLEHNRLIMIPELYMADLTHFDLTDGFCVDKVFEKTSELKKYTKTNCKVDLDPFELISIYRDQNDIIQSCESKDNLVSLQKQLLEIQEEKLKMLMMKDDMEQKIIQMKIYKNAMC